MTMFCLLMVEEKLLKPSGRQLFRIDSTLTIGNEFKMQIYTSLSLLISVGQRYPRHAFMS